MSAYLDIYMGNKDVQAEEEAAYSRAVKYCKQETSNLFGAQVSPEVCPVHKPYYVCPIAEVLSHNALQDLDEGQRTTLASVYESNPSLVVCFNAYDIDKQ